ncbi:hypothetical protein AGMMS49975_04280 [Clostridia bacterium]|nr:hypothetical protein AGMMS49975_04280 [Clostridia bacterium]
MTAIIKKEMRSYFTSMIGYVLLAGFVFFNALMFTLVCIQYKAPDYSFVMSASAVIFLVMIPLLTMRLFAEESGKKTDQLLYTAPVRISSIVAGKFLSAFLFLLFAMAITMLFPLSVSAFGALPAAKIAGSFLGYALLGGAFISVGMFVSVLTSSQITAAFGTFGGLFVFYILGAVVQAVPTDTTTSVVFVCLLLAVFCYILFDATRNIFAGLGTCIVGLAVIIGIALKNPLLYDGVIVKFLNWFSLTTRFGNFTNGILNLSDIVYYITFTLAFIYFTINVIEKRRWR